MTFAEAARFVITFGPHKGQTIDEIASTDAGLLWVDRLRGERSDDAAKGQPLTKALQTYCDDATISRDILRLVRK